MGAHIKLKARIPRDARPASGTTAEGETVRALMADVILWVVRKSQPQDLESTRAFLQIPDNDVRYRATVLSTAKPLPAETAAELGASVLSVLA